ncbi:MAG: glycogen/starch synthase [Rikenellaceae bacterium]|nr:glycogen/starch synthase [Rikenellaceae bacterium]
MSKKKILYVCQGIMPYLPENHQNKISRMLPQAIQEKGYEIRIFMPKYGCINERRNQLHEVIRLSGMNLIIDDNDHQLIIKVASIPSARVQIYFIDNEEYFQRKYVLTDEDGKYFEDNDERGIFFARGIIETVKKLRWSPGVVHCHGWFSGFIAMYLKKLFADDPLFSGLKVVISLYKDGFSGQLNGNIINKIEEEDITGEELKLLEKPDYMNFIKFLSVYADGIVYAEEGIDENVRNFIDSSGIPVLDCPQDDNYVEKYAEFYDRILE